MKKRDGFVQKDRRNQISGQTRVRGMYGSRYGGVGYAEDVLGIRELAAAAFGKQGMPAASGLPADSGHKSLEGKREQYKVHSRGKESGGAISIGQEIVKGRSFRIEPVPAAEEGVLTRLRDRLSLRGVLFLAAAAAVIAAAIVLLTFNLRKMTVYGTDMYSQEQIESYMTKGYLGRNTFLLALKYHNRKVTDLPFVDRISANFVNSSTIRVNIKEKAADGYVFYKGKNVYLSKEGGVQEVSSRKIRTATQVYGVVLTHSNSGSRALAKNQFCLDLTLELMRVMDKYGIREAADLISADDKSNLTVSFGDVKVQLGRSGYDSKMYRIQQILPYLKGKSGTICMAGLRDYSDSNIVLLPETADEKDKGDVLNSERLVSCDLAHN